MKPMKLLNEKVSTVQEFIDDPAWVLEQKMDGTRGLVRVRNEAGRLEFRWFSGSGGELKFAAAKRRLPVIEKALVIALSSAQFSEIWLDGEVMIDSGEFRIFDLPEATTGVWTLSGEYWQRRDMLHDLVRENETIRFVKTALTPEEKRELFEQVATVGGEGVVAKRIDGTYEPGKRPKHSRKLKFVKTADVIVREFTRGRNAEGREIGSAEFGVYDNGEWVPLGSCSLIGKPEVEEGSVIEVAYLFRGAGGKLVQPRLMRLREDKPAADCGMDQFPAYSREAV